MNAEKECPIDLYDIYPDLNYVERMLNDISLRFFGNSVDKFEGSEEIQSDFVSDYETMQAQLAVASKVLFDVRVNIEFLCGVKSYGTEARARINSELADWYKRSVAV